MKVLCSSLHLSPGATIKLCLCIKAKVTWLTWIITIVLQFHHLLPMFSCQSSTAASLIMLRSMNYMHRCKLDLGTVILLLSKRWLYSVTLISTLKNSVSAGKQRFGYSASTTNAVCKRQQICVQKNYTWTTNVLHKMYVKFHAIWLCLYMSIYAAYDIYKSYILIFCHIRCLPWSISRVTLLGLPRPILLKTNIQKLTIVNYFKMDMYKLKLCAL